LSGFYIAAVRWTILIRLEYQIISYMETEAVTELRKIRTDLDMLTNLYSKLVDRLIPEEEPEPEDLKAIQTKDKIASESELLKVLDA
jgi:hypothetical protein